jgi:hypothetical protein
MKKEELLERLNFMMYWCQRSAKDRGEKLDSSVGKAHNEIRALIKNRPLVDEKFIEKWVYTISIDCHYFTIREDSIGDDIRCMLKEAGVEIEEEK